MVVLSKTNRRIPAGNHHVRGGFSLLELLVVICLTLVLLTLMSPALRFVRESARQVACGSNLRQLGYGVAMFLDDHQDKFPDSVWADPRKLSGDDDYVFHLEQMMMVNYVTANGVPNWDGLGHLFAQKYVPDGEVFYCPSHYSEHSYARYAEDWVTPGQESIYGNFHYRGLAPKFSSTVGGNVALPMSRTRYETLLKLPFSVTLAADGMRTRYDYNHRVGNSMLKLDLSVQWYADPWATDMSKSIYGRLPEVPTAEFLARTEVWAQLDRVGPGNDGFTGGSDGGGTGSGARASMFLNRDRKRGN